MIPREPGDDSDDLEGGAGDETWIQATHFASKESPCGLPVSIELSNYVQRVGTWIADRRAAPCLVFARMATPTGVPEERLDARVTYTTAIVHDLDVLEPDPVELVSRVQRALPRMRFAIHSTLSSAPGAWKHRLVLPVSRPLAHAEHRPVWRATYEHLRDAGITPDPACVNESRIFFIPAIPPNGAYFAHVEPGESLDVDAWLDVVRELAAIDAEAAALEARRRTALRRARPAKTKASAFDRARAYVSAVPGAVSGAGGHTHTFTLALKLVEGFELSYGDALALMSEWNSSCSPPWSARDLERKVRQASEQGRASSGFLLDVEQ